MAGVEMGVKVIAEGLTNSVTRRVMPLPRFPDAFTAFFRAEYAQAVRLARLLTGDTSAAEDVVQDAFWRLHPQFDRLDNPAAYLRVSVVNACHNYHRRRKRETARLRELSASEPLPLGAAELVDALAKLPYRQRPVLVLRYYGGLSETEIAEALDCRPGTVKSLAARGLARLRKEAER